MCLADQRVVPRPMRGIFMSSSQSSNTGPLSGRPCVACGRDIPWEANVCTYCGHDYRISPLEAPVKRQTSLPIFGGLAIVIGGLLAILMAIVLLMMTVNDFQDLGGLNLGNTTPEDFVAFAHQCGMVDIVFGAIAIVGGVFALTRKHFGLAVTGGVFAILGLGLLIGSLLGLIGLILVVVSRKDFG
jgi:hypothetical protein